MVANALLTSKNQEWETPPEFFQRFHRAYDFTVDACASAENKKLDKFWSVEQDGLAQSWKGERVWLNPPYENRKPGQQAWVRKALHEVRENGCELVVCLLPARTDTRLFHDVIMKASYIYFVKGRLKFVGAPASAVFPSMVVVFDQLHYRGLDPWWSVRPTFGTINAKELVKHVEEEPEIESPEGG